MTTKGIQKHGQMEYPFDELKIFRQADTRQDSGRAADWNAVDRSPSSVVVDRRESGAGVGCRVSGVSGVSGVGGDLKE